MTKTIWWRRESSLLLLAIVHLSNWFQHCRSATSVALNVTPCHDLDQLNHGGPKFWGPSCEFPCHCSVNVPCDFTGSCHGACEKGFVKKGPYNRCQATISEPPRRIFKRLATDHFSVKNRVIQGRTKSDNNYKYRFLLPDNICVKDSITGVKTWTILLNQSLIIKQISAEFSMLAAEGERVIFKTHHSTFSQSRGRASEEEIPKSDNGTMHDSTLRHIVFAPRGLQIGDTFLLEVHKNRHNETPNAPCSDAELGLVVVTGQPVCEFGHWGAWCDEECMCICENSSTRICTIIEDSCEEVPSPCPLGTFGPHCSLNCSDTCSENGRPGACHVISGVCNDCAFGVVGGRFCDPASRQGLINTSQGIPCSIDLASPKTSSATALWSQSANAGFIILVSLVVCIVIFIVAVCLYIRLTHYFIRKRVRKQMRDVKYKRGAQSSLVSYGELDKEFKELYKGLSSFPALASSGRSSTSSKDTKTTLPTSTIDHSVTSSLV